MIRTIFTTILGVLSIGLANAQTASEPVRIGVLNDMSGVYSDDQGPGSKR